MSYHNEKESKYLPLSGVQNFVFCPRQWALMNVEQTWSDNYLTTSGSLFHDRAHDDSQREYRNGILTLRNIAVVSHELGFSGKCDVVEFRKDDNGVGLYGEEGKFAPYPVEYKRGRPKPHRADEAQLCAQAMALEEMLCCEIPEGSLFYGETRRRTIVPFDDELRDIVRNAARQMHEYFERGHVPKVKLKSGCKSCSIVEECLPKLMKHRSVSEYVSDRMVDV